MHTSPFSKEPGHDEIALCAFLIWEREGCQPGQEMTYWLQAEREVRATYQKKQAEQIAALAAKPWPPAPRVSAAPSAPATKITTKTVTKPGAIKPATKVVAKSVTKTTTKTLTKAAPKTAPVTKVPLTTAARLAAVVKTPPITKSSARASFSAASKPAARAVRRAA